MSDEDWRELERRLVREPGDEALVARAIAARRRAGAPVPWRLERALTRPGFTFAAPAPLGVAIARPGERHRFVGATGQGPVDVPAHTAWWVSPVVVGARAPDDALARRITSWLTSVPVAWPLDDPPALDLEDWPRTRLDWLGRAAWLRVLRLGRDHALLDSHLAALEPLEALEELDLHAPAVTDAGVVRLAALRGLRSLALRCPHVGDTAMSWVARLERLSDLRLSDHAVTDTGLERLLPLAELDSVAVAAGSLGPRGLAALARLPALCELTLRPPVRRLTEAQLDRFRDERPDVRLIVVR